MSFMTSMCAPTSVFLFNARTLLPKINDLCVTIENFQPKVMVVTDDNLLNLPRFDLFRAESLFG